jgi:hypothetical protein
MVLCMRTAKFMHVFHIRYNLTSKEGLRQQQRQDCQCCIYVDFHPGVGGKQGRGGRSGMRAKWAPTLTSAQGRLWSKQKAGWRVGVYLNLSWVSGYVSQSGSDRLVFRPSRGRGVQWPCKLQLGTFFAALNKAATTGNLIYLWGREADFLLLCNRVMPTSSLRAACTPPRPQPKCSKTRDDREVLISSLAVPRDSSPFFAVADTQTGLRRPSFLTRHVRTKSACDFRH